MNTRIIVLLTFIIAAISMHKFSFAMISNVAQQNFSANDSYCLLREEKLGLFFEKSFCNDGKQKMNEEKEFNKRVAFNRVMKLREKKEKQEKFEREHPVRFYCNVVIKSALLAGCVMSYVFLPIFCDRLHFN